MAGQGAFPSCQPSAPGHGGAQKRKRKSCQLRRVSGNLYFLETRSSTSSMKTRSQSAFTLIEMLVVISIIAVLAAFAVPALTSALTKGQMTGTMNNGRQLYLAGQQMALDGSANSDPNLGWPADVGDNTLNLYVTRLVNQNYLKVGDVQKLLSGPGASAQVTSSTAGTPPVTTITVAGTAAFKIYPVADADASNVIFATSRNYSYNSVLTPTAGGVANNPFGDKGFV